MFATRRAISVWAVCLIVGSGFGALVALTPGARALVYFSDSFDPAPLPGWTVQGLPPGNPSWHVADDSAGGDPCFGSFFANHPPTSASSPNSFAYHFDTAPPAAPFSECTYDLDDGGGGSAPNAGTLISPIIDLSLVAAPIWLHFSTWRENEGGSFWDLMTVQVDVGLGPNQVLQLLNPPGGPQTAWQTIDIDLSFAAGSATVTILFNFDTTDDFNNRYAGWYVDDFLVDDVSPPIDTLTFTPFTTAPPAAYAGDLRVLMGGLDMTVDANTADVISVNLQLSGLPPADVDIAWTELWVDDGDGIFIPGPDSPIAGSNVIFGAMTFGGISVLVTTGFPMRLWITFDISFGATPGDWVGFYIFDATSVRVTAPDVVVCAACPYDTYIPGVQTLVLQPPIDNLTFTPFTMAPATVFPGDTFVLMGGIDVSVDNNSATVDSITVALTGLPPSDADIAVVFAHLDNGNGFFEPFIDNFLGNGFFFGGFAFIPFGPPLVVDVGLPQRLWITYDISAAAVPGDFVGLAIGGPGSLTVLPPDNVFCTGCPFDTYVPLAATEILPAPVDNVTITLTDFSPLSAAAGDLNVLMAAVDASVDNNTAVLESINLTLTGLPPADTDVNLVTLWLDDGDSVFNPGPDFPVSSAGFFGGVANIFVFSMITSGTTQRFWITYDIALGAVPGDYVGASIPSGGDIVVTNPDFVICVSCPFDTYAPGSRTLITPATVDNLTFEPFDLAPATAQPTDVVVMGGVNLSVDNNAATVTAMQFGLTGVPPSDTDLLAVIVFSDNGDGMFNYPADPFVGFGFPAGGVIDVFLFGPVTVSAGSPQTLWITYQIDAAAVIGDFVGLSVYAGSVSVGAPDNAVCVGCPIDTYVPATKTEIVVPTIDTLTFMPVDLAPTLVAPGTPDVLMGAIDLTVDFNMAWIDTITLNLTGLPPADFDIAAVGLWVDDGDLVFETAQDLQGPGGIFIGGTTAIPFGFPMWAAFPARIWVTYDIAPGATIGDFVGLSIDAAAVTLLAPDVTLCVGCPYDTYVPGNRTEIAINDPPEARDLMIDGFAAGSAAAGHILSITPAFDWTYFDLEAAAQTDHEVRVGTSPGASNMWAPGPAGAAGLSTTYAGLPLLDGTDYYFAVRVMDDVQWGPWNETLFHTNAILAPGGPLTPADLSRIPADPAAVMSWASGGADTESDTVTYEWQVSTDPGFATIWASGSGLATSSAPFTTTPGVIYYCRVRSDDGWETSAWVSWSFTANIPPVASFLGVDGYLDASAGIVHILSLAPLFNWSYGDGEGDPQFDHEVRVGSASGLSDLWAPGPAGSAGTSLLYGGGALSTSTDYFVGVRVHDGIEWGAWAEVMFHTNGAPPAPATPVTPPDMDPAVAYGPATTVTWTSGGADPDSDTVTFEWQVSTDPAFGTLDGAGNVSATSSGVFTTLAATTYYWRVRASDGWESSVWSSWQFNTSSVAANLVPVASFPGVSGFLDGTAGILHIVAGSPVLNWSYTDPESVAQSDYEVRIGTTSGGNNTWAPGPVSSAAGSVAYGGPALVDGTNYYFGVRVRDGTDWGVWVEVLFHTNTPPPAPVLVLPTNANPAVGYGGVTLDWDPVTDADGDSVTYSWQVSTSPGFGTLFDSGTGVTGTTDSILANPSTTYYWRVLANDGWEDGAYATAFTFVTTAAPIVTGSLNVTVTGPDGVISGATVRVFVLGVEVFNGTTNSAGVVQFPVLPLAAVTVTVTVTGYDNGSGSATLSTADPYGDVTVTMVRSTTTQPTGEFPWLIVAIIAIVAAVVLLLLFLMRRRKPKEEMAMTQLPPSEPATWGAPAEAPVEAPAEPGGPRQSTDTSSTFQRSSPEPESLDAALARLENLKKNGLIDEATYQAQRKEILSR